eukprot:TRINITY_DN38616_c0_g1_i1.p2 TRINITY_DN38616_c0_g1~~TRINITY_DN38616_c0_g1_i1.p2  ORF type:complete len:120 (+),score=8.12 TRINITY_DN38616_c0_g1_i1:1071-1430(+)
MEFLYDVVASGLLGYSLMGCGFTACCISCIVGLCVVCDTADMEAYPDEDEGKTGRRASLRQARPRPPTRLSMKLDDDSCSVSQGGHIAHGSPHSPPLRQLSGGIGVRLSSSPRNKMYDT